jgi:large subunit ribosomal protein L28
MLELIQTRFRNTFMAKTCPVTKKTSMVGGGYSNRTRATQFNPTGKTRRYPNMQKRRVYIPELKKFVRVEISTRGLKTMNKHGVHKTLKAAGVI